MDPHVHLGLLHHHPKSELDSTRKSGAISDLSLQNREFDPWQLLVALRLPKMEGNNDLAMLFPPQFCRRGEPQPHAQGDRCHQIRSRPVSPQGELARTAQRYPEPGVVSRPSSSRVMVIM